jgi:hypothetical protein
MMTLYTISGYRSDFVAPESSVAIHQTLSVVDQAISHMPVHNLLLYPGLPNFSKMRAALVETLSIQPDFSGRLRRNWRDLGRVRICNSEAGILLEEQQVNAPASAINLRCPDQALIFAAPEPAASVVNQDEPLIRLRISRLSDGSAVLGICTIHSLTDGGGLSLFLHNLARILRGQPAQPVELGRYDIEHDFNDWRHGLKMQQATIQRTIFCPSRDIQQVYNGLNSIKRKFSPHQKPHANIKPALYVCIDQSGVEQLYKQHGVVVGHVLNAMVLQALSKTRFAQGKHCIMYVPVLDVRGRIYPDNYTGNAVLMGVSEVAMSLVQEDNLKSLGLKLFADNMKALKKDSLRAFISLMRFFRAEIFFHLLKNEVSIMIDNISELSFASVDLGYGVPNHIQMPPPSGIRMPFVYIYRTQDGGLMFQLSNPFGDCSEFCEQLAITVNKNLPGHGSIIKTEG